jgi:hypothetical protein
LRPVRSRPSAYGPAVDGETRRAGHVDRRAQVDGRGRTVHPAREVPNLRAPSSSRAQASAL